MTMNFATNFAMALDHIATMLTIYQDGFSAALRGHRRNENPWVKGWYRHVDDDRARKWYLGWDDGHELRHREDTRFYPQD